MFRYLLTAITTASLPILPSFAQEAEQFEFNRWDFVNETTAFSESNPDPKPLPEPPDDLFNIVEYTSPGVGELGAYLTPDPGDNKKHPAIIWITGGLSNTIGDVWTPRDPSNDQSASAFRDAGIVMMFPSLRGGNENPGKIEWMFSETTDIIRAYEYLAAVPYVDPDRIYLGGHSTGGTLVFLTAETTDKFRAAFSFGPTVAGTVFDVSTTIVDFSEMGRWKYNVGEQQYKGEIALRAPIAWLHSVRKPLYVLEGSIDGNGDQVELMEQESSNPLIQFALVPNKDHFDILHPANKFIAQQILSDDGVGDFRMSLDELKTFVAQQ